MHNLKIEVEDPWEHPAYIRVTDWSEYDLVLPVTNRVLKIEIPGHEGYVIAPFPQGVGFTYNSKGLKIAPVIENLNDGLWIFTYSVAPNEKVFTKVFHFRTVILERSLYCAMVSLLSNQISPKAYTNFVSALLMLKALKATTIDEITANVALNMYRKIETTINQISNIL